MKISAYILTKNEERYVRNCIESIKDVVDEIIIVDGYSVDKTVEICKEYTDKIYPHKFSGMAGERIFAISKTTNEWVLQIDADETLSEDLKNELRNLIQIKGYVVHSFARRNYYDMDGKKWTKHCYYPDYNPRLFKKSNLTHNILNTTLEECIIDGKTKYAPLNLYINHYVPYKYELSNFKNQYLRSTKMQGRWKRHPELKLLYLVKLPFVYINHFLYMAIFDRWYLDGIIGLKAASTMALYMVMVNYYTAFDDDKYPLMFLKLFERNDPNQKYIDDIYKIKIWKDQVEEL